jgi:hypothetical protein
LLVIDINTFQAFSKSSFGEIRFRFDAPSYIKTEEVLEFIRSAGNEKRFRLLILQIEIVYMFCQQTNQPQNPVAGKKLRQPSESAKTTVIMNQ